MLKPRTLTATRFNSIWKWIVLTLVCLSVTTAVFTAETVPKKKPNILWISSEDHGPQLGSYGDTYANTPNLDAFASRSLRYTKASSNAPVCAPARTTLISGMYPTSLGAHHMRSRVPSPDHVRFFPNYLQAAGYYTANNVKEDYNLLTDDTGWDDSSKQAHWRNRLNPEQPFFAVFNYTGTHESQIRNENPNPTHDPQLAPLPPYHPDTPEVRKDWAQYYDRLSQLDAFFQARLEELEADGLAEDTIVIFWADHGSGMPRSKRFPGWSGLHVPLIVHIPEKYRHLAPEDYMPGAKSDRLVSFVDYAPTTLSLAGIDLPTHFQGHAFLGESIQPAPAHSFGFRGRMDERPDECRSVTDGRFLYIRNYLPHLPHGQYLTYQQETPTTKVWYTLFNEGKLTPIQSAFWRPHPAEELYDLMADPHETVNLAADASYEHTLKQLREALREHQKRTRDLYFIPEPILRKPIIDGESPATYFVPLPIPTFDQLLSDSYQLSSNIHPQLLDTFMEIKRYWKANTLLEPNPTKNQTSLIMVAEWTEDNVPVVAVTSCEAVALKTTDYTMRNRCIDTLMSYARFPENELILSIHALNALDHIREAGIPLPETAKELTSSHPDIPDWASSYRSSLIKRF